jgi:hypothetical protein
VASPLDELDRYFHAEEERWRKVIQDAGINRTSRSLPKRGSPPSLTGRCSIAPFMSLQCVACNASSTGGRVKQYLGSAQGRPLDVPAACRRTPMWILLLLPFVGLLWVPFYNFTEPSLFGFPFFYWYQFLWVPITSFLIWVVYRSRSFDEAS